MNDLTKYCDDLENDDKQRYEFCKNQISLESKIWQDEIMFTELMKNENNYIKENVLNFLKDMAKLEKDNNDHIESLKSKVEREKYENQKQVEQYLSNLGTLKRVIEVDGITEVLKFKKDLEIKNNELENELEELYTKNTNLKQKLQTQTNLITEVQDDNKEDLTELHNKTEDENKELTTKLESIESEIIHLEEPLDKILTCVGRMHNQLKSDSG